MTIEAKIEFPHDSLFKRAMRETAVAKAMFEKYLPASKVALMDFSQLKLHPASYIDDAYRQSESDIVYQVPVRGEAGYIYVLAEHQSTPDKWLAFRLMKYRQRLWDDHIHQGHDKLPLVIPLVYYNGAIQYPYSNNFFDLFENKSLAEQYLHGPFNLVDVSQLTDKQILSRPETAYMEMIMRYKKSSKNFLVQMQQLLESGILRQMMSAGQEQLLRDLVYFTCRETNFSSKEKLARLVGKVSEQAEEVAMTYHDRVLEEGRQEGVREAAKALLREGVSPELVERATGYKA